MAQATSWTKRWYVRVLALVAILVVAVAGYKYATKVRPHWENGNFVVGQDTFAVEATPGAELVPYDFFLVMEQNNGRLIRDNESMTGHHGYPSRVPTADNPDGLSVGFGKGTYDGKAFVGLTCAACHTAKPNANGAGVQVNRAASLSNLGPFLADLATAMRDTADPQHEERRARFVKNVLAMGTYGSQDEVLSDLDKYAKRLTAISATTTPHTVSHTGLASADTTVRLGTSGKSP
ncbi:MAG TPA: hypothetical protein VNU97_14915 [Rhizomicrobium sp.]|nr:hypothetical protein [Rhizomicrobium sp.]